MVVECTVVNIYVLQALTNISGSNFKKAVKTGTPTLEQISLRKLEGNTINGLINYDVTIYFTYNSVNTIIKKITGLFIATCFDSTESSSG